MRSRVACRRRRRVSFVAAGWLLVLALGCGKPPGERPARPAGPAPSAEPVRYRVAVDADLARLSARVCFPDRPPAALVTRAHPAPSLRRARTAEGAPLSARQARIELGERVGAGGCVLYEVDLGAGEGGRGGRRSDALITDPRRFLLRPDPLPADFAATLEVELPGELSLLAPWPSRGDTYELDRSALTLPGHVAVGRFDVDAIEVDGGTIRIALLGEMEVGAEGVRAWIEAAARAVTTLYGRFPASAVTVLVSPVGPGRDPVAFGLVRRGGGSSVLLLPRRDASAGALASDWVVVHELAHLAQPRLELESAWLSEGLATYYQELLRARAGLITPARAWENLLSGFERGRRAGTGRPLAEESAAMRETHAYHRVYWAGTAYALELDVTLRSETGGRLSLDSLLEALAPALAGPARVLSGVELLALLDEAAGSDLPSRLAARFAARVEFPDVAKLLADLGVASGADETVSLRDDAPLADIRRALTAPP